MICITKKCCIYIYIIFIFDQNDKPFIFCGHKRGGEVQDEEHASRIVPDERKQIIGSVLKKME